jgi:hypothetical protein
MATSTIVYSRMFQVVVRTPLTTGSIGTFAAA